eukprot:12545-Karenia_brevis.AAC.1
MQIQWLPSQCLNLERRAVNKVLKMPGNSFPCAVLGSFVPAGLGSLHMLQHLSIAAKMRWYAKHHVVVDACLNFLRAVADDCDIGVIAPGASAPSFWQVPISFAEMSRSSWNLAKGSFPSPSLSLPLLPSPVAQIIREL